MLKPAPELNKLDYFVGAWKLEGEIQANAMSPGGHLIETNHNEWMDGGFFLVVRSEFTISGMKAARGIAYLGYDSAERVYTYDEFNSMGEAIHSKGSVEGNMWTWNGERNTENTITKTRWVVTITSPASYDFKFEMSADEANWNTIVEGKAVKHS